ncbi:hypothetical protein B0H13DRAFT_2018838, partial [Mycena leptocephala]
MDRVRVGLCLCVSLILGWEWCSLRRSLCTFILSWINFAHNLGVRASQIPGPRTDETYISKRLQDVCDSTNLNV